MSDTVYTVKPETLATLREIQPEGAVYSVWRITTRCSPCVGDVIYVPIGPKCRNKTLPLQPMRPGALFKERYLCAGYLDLATGQVLSEPPR